VIGTGEKVTGEDQERRHRADHLKGQQQQDDSQIAAQYQADPG
jgi:hypothetical protein